MNVTLTFGPVQIPRQFLPVLTQAFSELTVLGFIGVISLLITQKFQGLAHDHGESRSAMNVLSEWIFHDEEHLEHRFHEVHYQIFFLMMSFIGMVCFLLLTSTILARYYESYERSCRSMYRGEHLTERKSWKFTLRWQFLRPLFVTKWSLSEHQVFRDRFVTLCTSIKISSSDKPDTSKPGDKPDPRVPEFDFGVYRSRKVMLFIQKLLKLTLVDWTALYITVVVFSILFDPHHPIESTIFLVFIAIANLVTALFWVRCCVLAKKELLPCQEEDLKICIPGCSYEHGPIPVADANSRDLPKYLTRKFKIRTGSFEKFIYQVPANQQEQLFWGENHQASWMLGTLRLITFLTVIEIATACSMGHTTIFGVGAWLGVLCLFAYIATIIVIARGVHEYSLVTSIEKMKDPKCAEEVLRELKVERAAEVWDAMKHIGIVASKFKHSNDPADIEKAKLRDVKSETEEEKHLEANIREKMLVFAESSETSSDGEVQLSYTAAHALMIETWTDVLDIPPEDMHKSIQMMDLDNSGTINAAEFISITITQLRNFHAKKHPEDNIRKAIDTLFENFDADNSGTLNTEELKKIFGKWFDIEDLFLDMDTSGDGQISKQEFLDYVLPILGVRPSAHGDDEPAHEDHH